MPLHVFLLYALLIGNVTLRFFTNYLQLIPRIFNLLDVGIALLFGLLLFARLGQGRKAEFGSVLRRLVWFNVVAVLGCALNARYFEFRAAVSQLLMLNEPFLVFLALVNLPFTASHVAGYQRILRRLVLLELIIGVCQIPVYISTGESESFMGTFQHNADQYAGFLLIGVLYFLGMAKAGTLGLKACTVLVAGSLVLILCIDNKASWPGLAISLSVVLWKLGLLEARLLRPLAPVLILAGVTTFGWAVVSRSSGTLYKFQLLGEAWETGNIRNLGKVKAYVDIARSHTSSPHMALVGSGLSTFYSRSCRQFYLSPTRRERMYSNAAVTTSETRAEDEQYRASSSMGGVITAAERIPYYDKFYGSSDLIFAVGSIQVDSPFSPYAGLLGESGLIGTWLYLSMYAMTLRLLLRKLSQYKTDPAIGPLVVASLGFLIYTLVSSIYGPWLEYGRMSTLLWSMIGLVFVYDRYRSGPGQGNAGLRQIADPTPCPGGTLVTRGFATERVPNF